jgi:hypothetical protein
VGETRADIILTPDERGEWIISPDVDSGGVEVELSIRGQRYFALFREDESSMHDETMRQIADELDAGTPGVNVNSAFLGTLGRKPFFLRS